MENLLFLGVPILKHIRVTFGSISSQKAAFFSRTLLLKSIIHGRAPVSPLVYTYFICINISTFNSITIHNILYKWDSEESQ